MPHKKYVQKYLIQLYLLATFLILICAPVKANDIKQAEIYIQNLSNQIILTVENDSSLEKKHDALHDLFKKNASILTISRAAIGSKWRTLKKDTRKSFSDAFTTYLVKKYGKQFEEFRGAKLIVERSIDAGRRGILVHTRLIMPATPPISVKWQIWQKTEDFKLIDIIIEDISMLTMEREEMKNRLAVHQGNITALIADLSQN